MTYYVIATVRERCLGDPTDQSQDPALNRFGNQADSLINDMLFITANRNRRLFALPAIPLSNPPQSLIDASNDLAVALFARWQGEEDRAKGYEKQAQNAVDGYILRLESDASFYGVPLD